MNTKTKGFLMALPILAVVALLWLAYFSYTLSPSFAEATEGKPVGAVIIQKGDGLTDIAQKLEDARYIRSASAFKFYSIITGSGHKLKPGLYNISPASSTVEIVGLLVAGPSKEIEVLVTEGETMTEIEGRLSGLGIIQAGDFRDMKLDELWVKYPFLAGARSLEGYLFPDTYRFFFASNAKDAVVHFLDNFSDKVAPLISDGENIDYDNIPIVRRGMYSIDDIVTIASLIEKEVPDVNDRKMVADIIYRRLKMGMALQIDASVDYAKEVGSPEYDTYKFPGLPKGPISNPGLSAIESALNPKANTYLYYLSDPKTKKTIFSKTFDEHKANKAKYLGR